MHMENILIIQTDTPQDETARYKLCSGVMPEASTKEAYSAWCDQ